MVLGLLLASLMMQPVNAQVSRATITEILDGNQVYIQNQQARVNSVAQRQQQVRTGRSRAELRFNTGAIARLAQNSRLTVGDCAQLRRGTLLVNGTMNGCTQSTLAGVRGTLYTLDVDDTGQETIRVFEGEVVVSAWPGTPEESPPALGTVQPQTNGVNTLQLASNKQWPTWPHPSGSNPSDSNPSDIGSPVGGAPASPSEPDPGVEPRAAEDSSGDAEAVDLTGEPITLAAGQQLTVTGGAADAAISFLSADDFTALLTGELLSEFSQEIPGMADLRRSFETLFPTIPFPGIPNLPSVPLPFPF